MSKHIQTLCTNCTCILPSQKWSWHPVVIAYFCYNVPFSLVPKLTFGTILYYGKYSQGKRNEIAVCTITRKCSSFNTSCLDTTQGIGGANFTSSPFLSKLFHISRITDYVLTSSLVAPRQSLSPWQGEINGTAFVSLAKAQKIILFANKCVLWRSQLYNVLSETFSYCRTRIVIDTQP